MKTTLLFTFVLGMTLNVHADDGREYCEAIKKDEILAAKTAGDKLIAEGNFRNCLKEFSPKVEEKLSQIETKEFSSDDIRKVFRRSVIAYSYDRGQVNIDPTKGKRLTDGDNLCKKLTKDADSKASESVIEVAPKSEKMGVAYNGLFSVTPEIIKLDDENKFFGKYKSVSCVVLTDEAKQEKANAQRDNVVYSSPLKVITEVITEAEPESLGEKRVSEKDRISEVKRKEKEEASYISSDFQSLIDKSQNVSR